MKKLSLEERLDSEDFGTKFLAAQEIPRKREDLIVKMMNDQNIPIKLFAIKKITRKNIHLLKKLKLNDIDTIERIIGKDQVLNNKIIGGSKVLDNFLYFFFIKKYKFIENNDLIYNTVISFIINNNISSALFPGNDIIYYIINHGVKINICINNICKNIALINNRYVYRLLEKKIINAEFRDNICNLFINKDGSYLSYLESIMPIIPAYRTDLIYTFFNNVNIIMRCIDIFNYINIDLFLNIDFNLIFKNKSSNYIIESFNIISKDRLKLYVEKHKKSKFTQLYNENIINKIL